MLTASDSESDLPVFPLLGPASRHDSHGFFYNWFSMKQFLPEAHVYKLLLDSAHDSMAYYEYCRDHGIQPFIDLNDKCGRPPFIKTTLQLEKMVSLSVKKASACAGMALKPPKAGLSSNALKSVSPEARPPALVIIPVRMLPMGEPYIW